MTDAPSFNDFEKEDIAQDIAARAQGYIGGIARTRPPMPPEIAKAIVQVCSKIKGTLSKEDEVKAEGKSERGYRYVSVDQFYELAGPLMAEAGIFVVAYEAKLGITQKDKYWDGKVVGKTNWLDCEFDFVIYHQSGAEFGPIRRTIQVIASGPQAYASAQSYLEKYFLRNLFKIATYDPETVEEHGKDGLPGTEDKSLRRNARNQINSIDERDRMIKEIGACQDAASLEEWLSANDEDAGRIFPEDKAAVLAEFKRRRKDLREALNTAPTEAKAIPEEAPARLRNAPSSADPF
jgi:hypothetical protein